MEWIELETLGLGSPPLADERVGGEALESFWPTAEAVGGDEVGEMPLELSVFVVVLALDGRVLDGAVHPLDLPVGPRVAAPSIPCPSGTAGSSRPRGMQRLGQPVQGARIGARRREGVAAEENARRSHRLDVLGRPAVAGGVGDVRAMVRQRARRCRARLRRIAQAMACT